MADPEEPERPGNPVPLGDLTTSLMRDVALMKLAEEVAASSEQHVVLLEDHRMGMTGLPANVQAAGKLAAAGFAFCSEADERLKDHKASVDVVVGFPPQHKTQIRVGEQLEKAVEEFASASRPGASPLRTYRVGDLLVSAKEAWEEARRELGKERLRLEDLYIAPLKQFIQMNMRFFSKDEKFKILRRSVEKNHPKLGFPLALFDFSSALMIFQTPANIDFFAQRLCELNGISGDVLAQIEITREIKVLAAQIDKWRDVGAADKNTAHNAFSVLGKRRGLFVIGASHGILANNPASLPDQLVEQSKDKSKATVRLIQLVNKECARSLYIMFMRHAANNALRPDVMTYDFETGKKWDSVQEWLDEAPVYYGFPAKDAGPTPGNPPEPA